MGNTASTPAMSSLGSLSSPSPWAGQDRYSRWEGAQATEYARYRSSMVFCSRGSPRGSSRAMSSRRSASENTPEDLGTRGNSPWAAPRRKAALGEDWRTCSAVPKITWSTVWGISDTSSASTTSRQPAVPLPGDALLP